MPARSEGSPSWLPRLTADGTPTLVHAGHGEACHSRAGAWLEARERYALATRIAQRARDGLARVRLLDLGTGLGWNLAAALEALDGTGCALEAVTFEADPGVVEATLALPPAAEPHWRAVRGALEKALRDPGRAVALPDGGHLTLALGDARATLPALAPEWMFDAVFLDPFSPGVDPDLWELPFLEEVARRMAPASWLSTYTAAGAVRARLLAAGLRVGLGPACAGKREGTLASPDRKPPAFPRRLLGKLARRAERLRASIQANSTPS